MKKSLSFLFALAIFAIYHEAMHAIIAMLFGEYDSFHVRPFGLEITFKTPVAERSGFQWALISGTSNLATLMAGYGLLMASERASRLHQMFLKVTFYYLTLLFLLLDALNLSIGPFLYGGDANGIAVGLGVNRYLIQAFFFLTLLANRELVAQKLLPAFHVRTDHFLLRPWITIRC
ncbi:MAG: hypothetical protein HPY59_02360 [Anaerolineae bacterium]|nr:hypothetical protein [Anaerolineae bacterium]